MPASLAQRLRHARHERFVGREDERALFRRALRGDPLPFHLLYLHGPGGVGKTALLRELRYLCADGAEGETRAGHASAVDDDAGGGGNGRAPARSVAVHHVDARDVEPTPAAFQRALERAGAHDGDHGGRSVVMVDTFEQLQPLERWFREEFLPGLSQETLVVVAGRTPPPASWRGEAGLQALMRVVPLRNLSPDESRRYLARREVPENQRDAVADFACGHPLALSLAADGFDQRPDQPFAPADTPDLVRPLARRLIDEVPSAAHRRALEACALVRVLSEELLEHLLEEGLEGERSGEARALFEWLRTLSFVETGPRGLFPHDLAREVLVADLRWRRPERHDALAAAARRFYTERLRRTAEQDALGSEAPHRNALSDYLFLHRDNPVVAPLFARLRRQWEGRAFTAAVPREEDWPALAEMTRRHEGEASAELLKYWRDRPAAQTTVFRDEEGAPAGFSMRLALEETTEKERTRDPAVRAACGHLDAHAPLREGETATLFRYWMDRDEHQAISPVQSLIAARRVRHYLAAPALAFSLIACADPDAWALVFAYADMPRLEDADYEVGERSFALFGHDWRATPPPVWLDQMSERSFTEQPPEEVPPASPAPRLVLSREDFEEAAREAVKNVARPERLRESPLARSALVDEAEAEDAVDALQRLIRAAAGQMQGVPKKQQYYRALEAAYLDPVGTQREAAEAIGAAFSTFRRHLGRGIEHVVAALWARETGAPDA